MLRVKFDENGTLVADKKAQEFVGNEIRKYLIAGKQDTFLVVANSLPIYAFRVAVKEGFINPADIVFLTSDDIVINVDKDGTLDNWSTGFCDDFRNQLDKLLGI